MTVPRSDFLKEKLKVYFISGTNNVTKPLPKVLKEAISGGVTLFQFREKGVGSLIGDEKAEMATTLKQICHAHHIPFIVNDDVDLAIKVDADGIHVGQKDANAYNVRQQISEKMILGVSAHTLEEAKIAVENGADYIGVGPMFATTSKKDAEDVCGPEMITHMRRHGIHVPIVAIGGITAQRTGDILRAGADGVSLISAIASAPSAKQAAAEFQRECKRDS
ncbi:thiamine phosphate synthase [Salipaludibacillus daqingensis]|uniref:thiamine phosphate synthase n=1 Tax=Salipaludibacillus daqingensis TaxID=3041001 RepID=UPI0024748AC0|nr:thiamine phosphate synthase [Salipaludibacillus daqingensis]